MRHDRPGLLTRIFTSGTTAATMLAGLAGTTAFVVFEPGARSDISETLTFSGDRMSFDVAVKDEPGMDGRTGSPVANFNDSQLTAQERELYEVQALELKLKWHGRSEDWVRYQVARARIFSRDETVAVIDTAIAGLQAVRPSSPLHP